MTYDSTSPGARAGPISDRVVNPVALCNAHTVDKVSFQWQKQRDTHHRHRHQSSIIIISHYPRPAPGT